MINEKPKDFPKDLSDTEQNLKVIDDMVRGVLAVSREQSPSTDKQDFVRNTGLIGSKILIDQLDEGAVIPDAQEFAQAVHGVIKAEHRILDTGYVKQDADIKFQLSFLEQELPYRGMTDDEHRTSLQNLLKMGQELAGIDVYDSAYRGNLEDFAIYTCTMLGELAKSNPTLNLRTLFENEGMNAIEQKDV
jgi:hypothetical protein